MFEITIEKTFAAAHALRLPDGSLEPIHGHNWPVAVTVASPELDEIDTVMDFHILEGWLEALLATCHNRSFNEIEPFCVGGELRINPSAERIAQWIGDTLAAQLPSHVQLVAVALGEAPGCTAVYRP